MRLVLIMTVAGLLAAVTAAPAQSSLFFLFEPTSAEPGDTVTVRTGGTPGDFTRSDGRTPFRNMRLYLVPSKTAELVRSRFDPRIHFVGRLALDVQGRGALTFTVPPLDAGSYAVASWCPACAQHSRGRTFFAGVVKAKTVRRYRPFVELAVRPQSTAPSCPVTKPNGSKPPGAPPRPFFHGNGLLWSGFAPDKPVGHSRDGDSVDAAIFDKLGWLSVVMDGRLTVQTTRLDAAAPAARWKANEGGFVGSTFPGRSWATPLWFPSAGCWRLTARVADVSLSVVVRVREPA